MKASAAFNGTNTGRQINYVSGIQGVNPGGVATFNLPSDRRLHNIKLNCTAVNYTGGVGLATVKLTGAGNNNCTVTLTVVNGLITVAAVVAGGTGYVTGDTITPVDATGTGAVLTVTAAAGAVTALAVTVGGTPSAINPATFATGMRQRVNGVVMRDVSPAFTLQQQQANNMLSFLGELELVYTEEWRNLIRNRVANSWDITGQNAFTVELLMNPLVVSPGLTGVYEFDFGRNTRTMNGQTIPYLEPISHHIFSFPLAVGMNSLTTIPFSYPVARLWVQGTNAGNIYQAELLQDGNKILEGTTAQINARYAKYGFKLGNASTALYPNYENQTQTAQKPLGLNPINYFDTAFIADPDQRYTEGLQGKVLEYRLWSNVAQQVNILVEALPGAFQS
jgi:hypothetical protein